MNSTFKDDSLLKNLFNWQDASIQCGEYPVKEGSLGDVLFKARIISGDDMIAALKEQERAGVRFGEALISLGIVTQEDVDWALSNQLGIPYIRLEKDMIDPAAISLVPEDICRSHNLLPLIKAGGELSIAIADPLDTTAIDAVQKATGCRVNVSVALIREIREMIDACYGARSRNRLDFASTLFSAEALDAIQEDNSCGKLLEQLLDHLVRNHLSSISMQPFPEGITLTGRCSGHNQTIGHLARSHYQELASRLRILATGSSGRFTHLFHGKEIQLQLATLQGEFGEYLTLRRHITSPFPADLEALAIPPRQKQRFAMLAHGNQGVVFVASRNRSERCRFTDMLLDQSETEGLTILGLGLEPGRMQKRFPRIPLPQQEQDQARLIMDSLAHEPDLLVVEDATFPESCIAVCRAAMGRRKVIAGFDVRGATNLLELLIRHRRGNPLLTSFISGLVSFKGIQLLCPDCRHEYQPTDDERAALGLPAAPPAFYRADGCEACSFTGVGERRFLTDVLVFDDDLRKAFEHADNAAAVMACLHERGYQGADQEGLELLMQGLVSSEEYIAAVKL